MANHTLTRAKTERNEINFDHIHASQGKVLWLPAKEDLPERAVRRAHGKGAIEEGIYNHPVVVVSHPHEESQVVHFHLITSLQGKRLDQLYNKANEFHASRRSWYLPITPTPDHPDALSKKTKKRFPTLKLANGATLRWDSYVNIRHVYKINLSLLRQYTNPETPDEQVFRFEPESMVKMLAKGKSLTMYEAGRQFVSLGLKRSASEPTLPSAGITQTATESNRRTRSPASDTTSIVSVERSVASGPSQVDFPLDITDVDRIASTPPKVPPDGERKPLFVTLVQDVVAHPLEQFLTSMESMAKVVSHRPVALSFDPTAIRRPLDRAWRDLKGVTAIAIASI